MDKTKRSEIMGRIEDMRHDLKMGKSKFCAAFGVKPQTYNNFTGSQGSKPNIELLMGVVEAYRSHDRAGALAWILWGRGGPGVSNDDRLSRVEADVAKLSGHIHRLPRDATNQYEIYNTRTWSGPPKTPNA